MTQQSQQSGSNVENGFQKPKRLLLLRHGQIDRRHAGQLIGATDVSLDPVAEADLQATADRVMRWAPHACYCSPKLRCRQTAAAVAPGLPLHVDADLREIDFGQWETRVFADIVDRDAALLDRWAAFDLDFAFPGGERVGDFLHRIEAAAQRLAHAEAETVLVVAHGGVIRTMICHVLGLEPKHYVAFHVPYATTVVIDLFDGRGVLESLDPPRPVGGDSCRRSESQTSDASATGVASYNNTAPAEARHG